MVAEKSRGAGAGMTSWGWISSTGMTATVQQYQDIQSWFDYRHISDDLMGKEKILLQESVDANLSRLRPDIRPWRSADAQAQWTRWAA